MTEIADAIRKVTAIMQRRYDNGERSSQIDMWDLIEVLAFLKERGCVDVRRRRCFPASNFLVEDALIEFHALEA